MIIDVYRATANFPLCIEGDPSDTLAHRDDGFIQVVLPRQAADLRHDPAAAVPRHAPRGADADHARLLRHQGQPPQRAGSTVEPDARRSTRSRTSGSRPVPAARPAQRRHRHWATASRRATSRASSGRRRSGIERALDVLPRDRRRLRAALRPARPRALRRGRAGRRDERRRHRGRRHGAGLRHASKSLREACGEAAGLRVGGRRDAAADAVPARRAARAPGGRDGRAVVNQAHHYGRGHLTLDVADALSDLERRRRRVVSAFAGLGGADVSEATWETMLDARASRARRRRRRVRWLFHEGSQAL